jgi:hypothetical protein
MKMAIVVWSLVAAASLAPAIAQTVSSSTPEASAITKLMGKNYPRDSTNDPVWRALFADALHTYCESVLVQVPRNTPQEDHWLDKEQRYQFVARKYFQKY